MISSKKLKQFKSIKHGFFNRNGGKSSGLYKSLNCGIGSLDRKKNVCNNLAIFMLKSFIFINSLSLHLNLY